MKPDIPPSLGRMPCNSARRPSRRPPCPPRRPAAGAHRQAQPRHRGRRNALFLLLPLLLLIGLLVWAGDRKAPSSGTCGSDARRTFGCLKFRSMVTNGDAVLVAHLAANPTPARVGRDAQAHPRSAHHPDRRGAAQDQPGRVAPARERVARRDGAWSDPAPSSRPRSNATARPSRPASRSPPGSRACGRSRGAATCTYAERVALDLDYATRWSLSRDIAIMLRTIPAVLAQRGSR